MYGNSIRILNNDRGTVVTSSRWIIRCPINAVLIPLDVEFNRFYVRFPSRLFVLDASQYVYCTITRQKNEWYTRSSTIWVKFQFIVSDETSCTIVFPFPLLQIQDFIKLLDYYSTRNYIF